MTAFLLVSGDFVQTGGMDRANFALADFLARHGSEVHLVGYRVAQSLQDYPTVQVHQVPRLAGSYLLSEPLLNLVGRHQANKIQASGGRILVNGGNCLWHDINWVHYLHAAYQPSPAEGIFSRLKGLLARQQALITERQSLGTARLILANSNRTRQDLITHLNLPPERIRTLYYGIDPDLFYPANLAEKQALRQQLGCPLDQPILLFIGSVADRRKGFDTLFPAWQILCQDPNWQANLVVIGSGAHSSPWQDRVNQAGLASRIRFLGFRSDVPDWLRAADGLIAPTRYEAYGLGVHEALCCGIPALVSANAGVAERYPTTLQPLLLQDPEDVTDLTQHLWQWQQERANWQDPLQDLALTLRSYTWDHMAQAILNAIQAS